jgi:hypothetical protein
VLVGSGLSVIPVYGWILSAILGSIGILVAVWVPAQKDELVKTSSTSYGFDMILVNKDNINVRDSKREDINKESQ